MNFTLSKQEATKLAKGLKDFTYVCVNERYVAFTDTRYIVKRQSETLQNIAREIGEFAIAHNNINKNIRTHFIKGLTIVQQEKTESGYQLADISKIYMCENLDTDKILFADKGKHKLVISDDDWEDVVRAYKIGYGMRVTFVSDEEGVRVYSYDNSSITAEQEEGWEIQLTSSQMPLGTAISFNLEHLFTTLQNEDEKVIYFDNPEGQVLTNNGAIMALYGCAKNAQEARPKMVGWTEKTPEEKLAYEKALAESEEYQKQVRDKLQIERMVMDAEKRLERLADEAEKTFRNVSFNVEDRNAPLNDYQRGELLRCQKIVCKEIGRQIEYLPEETQQTLKDYLELSPDLSVNQNLAVLKVLELDRKEEKVATQLDNVEHSIWIIQRYIKERGADIKTKGAEAICLWVLKEDNDDYTIIHEKKVEFSDSISQKNALAEAKEQLRIFEQRKYFIQKDLDNARQKIQQLLITNLPTKIVHSKNLPEFICKHIEKATAVFSALENDYEDELLSLTIYFKGKQKLLHIQDRAIIKKMADYAGGCDNREKVIELILAKYLADSGDIDNIGWTNGEVEIKSEMIGSYIEGEIDLHKLVDTDFAIENLRVYNLVGSDFDKVDWDILAYHQDDFVEEIRNLVYDERLLGEYAGKIGIYSRKQKDIYVYPRYEEYEDIIFQHNVPTETLKFVANEIREIATRYVEMAIVYEDDEQA